MHKIISESQISHSMTLAFFQLIKKEGNHFNLSFFSNFSFILQLRASEQDFSRPTRAPTDGKSIFRSLTMTGYLCHTIYRSYISGAIQRAHVHIFNQVNRFQCPQACNDKNIYIFQYFCYWSTLVCHQWPRTMHVTSHHGRYIVTKNVTSLMHVACYESPWERHESYACRILWVTMRTSRVLCMSHVTSHHENVTSLMHVACYESPWERHEPYACRMLRDTMGMQQFITQTNSSQFISCHCNHVLYVISSLRRTWQCSQAWNK